MSSGSMIGQIHIFSGLKSFGIALIRLKTDSRQSKKGVSTNEFKLIGYLRSCNRRLHTSATKSSCEHTRILCVLHWQPSTQADWARRPVEPQIWLLVRLGAINMHPIHRARYFCNLQLVDSVVI